MDWPALPWAYYIGRRGPIIMLAADEDAADECIQIIRAMLYGDRCVRPVEVEK